MPKADSKPAIPKLRDRMQVSIPLAVVTQIVKIMQPLGYRTVSEFVNEAVRAHVRYKSTEYDTTILEP